MLGRLRDAVRGMVKVPFGLGPPVGAFRSQRGAGRAAHAGPRRALPSPRGAGKGRASARGVEALLGLEKTDLDERLDGVGALVQQEGEDLGALGLGEVLEDEVGGVLPPGGPA